MLIWPLERNGLETSSSHALAAWQTVKQQIIELAALDWAVCGHTDPTLALSTVTAPAQHLLKERGGKS
jgi:hypothetical protein